MGLMVRFVIVIIKIFIVYIKSYVFYIKHDGDMLGDAVDGVLSSLWDDYYRYKELLF